MTGWKIGYTVAAPKLTEAIRSIHQWTTFAVNTPGQHAMAYAFSRLDAYLPENVIAKVSFEDHYMYNEKELETLLHEHNATSILTTQKDAVKMSTFDIPLSILKLEVEIFPETKAKINALLAPKR